jgi:hypothetical protein
MKQLKNNIKMMGLMAFLLFAFSSCDDFLNRPTEDSYNVDNFYQTEAQCYQAVNPIYNSPWYDMQRFFIQAGEVMSGNIYAGGSNPYATFSVSSSDQNLNLASAALWSVNAYCNGVIENINLKAGPAVSQIVKNTVKGEALVWKAMAYFYLVRSYGAVPIIHDNSELISAGTYNEVYKATIPNVYDYIIMTLEQAIEWLPEKNLQGRLDRYCAYALLAKVYLTKSGYGQSGSRNQADLDNAAKYAKIVIDQSGRNLLPKYEDIFRLHNNTNEECLISWRWVSSTVWTSQNSLQSDLGVNGFDEFGANWGDWTGPSVDLQDAFGENALSLTRNNRDTRRKATMMMYGDCYDYFWRDQGGFCWTEHIIGTLKAANLSGTGANCVKHLVGNSADHEAEGGGPMYRMTNGLATHLLRLAEIYLIYAEAKIGNAASTSDPSALKVFNDVFLRAIPGETPKTSITWSDVWKERRLELAGEGDRWYDYVRWSYYNSEGAINELKNQRRAAYDGLKELYTSKSLDPNTTFYSKNPNIPNPAAMYKSDLKSFVFPFPDTDVVSNPRLSEDPLDQDISQYKY